MENKNRPPDTTPTTFNRVDKEYCKICKIGCRRFIFILSTVKIVINRSRLQPVRLLGSLRISELIDMLLQLLDPPSHDPYIIQLLYSK